MSGFSQHTILNNKHRLATALLLTGLYVAAASAEPVFKSVDPSGAVSYGDKPLGSAAIVREIPIQAGPSQQRIEAAQAAGRRILFSADSMEHHRLAREAVVEKQRKERELEQQFQLELETEMKQVELTAEAQRLAHQKQLDSQKPQPPKPQAKAPPTTSDKAINMRPNVPLLNLPGPAE